MYIRSTGSISPQFSFNQLMEQPLAYHGNRLTCVEPDYGKLIDPKMIRRMSRIIKIGVAAAMECLKEAGDPMPGAIITGTAYGCLADTDLFLTKMVQNNEELLSPTSFIQSTHNTVGAQIALILKCHNYNNTFVHRGFSFESALLDAITYSKDQQVENVLVGAIDEITDTSHAILSRFGLYKNNVTSSLDLFATRSKGTIAGEGSAFFLLTNQPSGNDYAELKGLYTFYKPVDLEEIKNHIQTFLASHALSIKDIDLVINGRNGDTTNDNVYTGLQQSLFAGTMNTGYKQLCGEYPTSSAFACWLAVNMIKSNGLANDKEIKYSQGKLKNVLIYNHYLGIHHSLYLLSSC